MRSGGGVKAVNPKIVARGQVLDEIIKKVYDERDKQCWHRS